MRLISCCSLLGVLSLLGCPDTSKDTSDTGEVGTDTADTGDSGDTETGDTETGDTAVEPVLDGVSWDYVEQTITTRDRLAIVITAHYDDGSTADVTADSTFSSTDENVAKSYTAGWIQPIGEGVTTIGGSYAGVDMSGVLVVGIVPATNADLIINEVLSDGTVDGDPNGDGTADSVQDEFIEIANVSDVTVSLAGCTLIEDDFYTGLPRHTFADGTILRAGEAIVVFGGGDVSALSAANVQFVAAVNGDSGLEYGLSFNNEGEHIELRDPTGGVLTSFAYGETTDVDAIEDASMVLTPDVWGTEYTHHSYATGSVGDFSPGTFVDGTPFPGVDGRY